METNSVSVAANQRVAVELCDWPWGLLTAVVLGCPAALELVKKSE